MFELEGEAGTVRVKKKLNKVPLLPLDKHHTSLLFEMPWCLLDELQYIYMYICVCMQVALS